MGVVSAEERPGDHRGHFLSRDHARAATVWGLGFRVSGFGFRGLAFGFRFSSFGSQISGFGLRVLDFGSGFRFSVSDFGRSH